MAVNLDRRTPHQVGLSNNHNRFSGWLAAIETHLLRAVAPNACDPYLVAGEPCLPRDFAQQLINL
jgi:hypothetical protein